MGFNNDGVDALVEQRQARRYRGILGINIGKNFDTPIERAADDYLICLRKVYPHASYVTVNISSPNTKNLRQLQQCGRAGQPARRTQGRAGEARRAARQIRAAGAEDRARPRHASRSSRSPTLLLQTPHRRRDRHQHHHRPRRRGRPAARRGNRRPERRAGAHRNPPR